MDRKQRRQNEKFFEIVAIMEQAVTRCEGSLILLPRIRGQVLQHGLQERSAMWLNPMSQLRASVPEHWRWLVLTTTRSSAAEPNVDHAHSSQLLLPTQFACRSPKGY